MTTSTTTARPSKGHGQRPSGDEAQSRSLRTPSHAAYAVRETKDGGSIWTKIGSAWIHADGQGFNVQLDALPVDGRVTLRVPTEKPETQA